MRGVCHLSKLGGTSEGAAGPGVRGGEGVRGCSPGGVRAERAHPVVVARLLQSGGEEEAAAGDARGSGTLDVPVGEGAGCAGPARPATGPLRPYLRSRYLARLAASGFVLSMATRFPCFRAVSQVVTQRCQEPSVSWGHERSQTDQQTRGERRPRAGTGRQ